MKPHKFLRVASLLLVLVAQVPLRAAQPLQTAAGPSRPARSAAAGAGSSAAVEASRAGNRLFARNKFEEARAVYARAIGLNPAGTPGAHRGLVRALLRLDRWPEAITAGAEAVRRFPKDAEARGVHALALLRGGQLETAEVEAKQGVSLNRFSYFSLVAAGQVAWWNEQEAEARRRFRQAASLRPDEPDAWLGLVTAVATVALDGEHAPDAASENEARLAVRRYLQISPRGNPHEQFVEYLSVSLPAESAKKRAFASGTSQALHPVSEARLRRYERFGEGTFRITVPVERGERGYVLLPVTINNKRLRLLFDTAGGNDVLLSKAAAARCKLSPVAGALVHGVYGKENATTHKARTLTLSGLTLGPVPITVVDRAIGGVDGVFGASMLRNYVVTLDLKNNTLTLARGKDAEAPPARSPGGYTYALPFRHRFDKVLVSLRVAGEPVWAIWDTGADLDVLSLRLAGRLAEGLPSDQVRRGAAPTGGANAGGLGTTDTQVRYVTFQKTFPVAFGHAGENGSFTYPSGVGASPVDKQVSLIMGFEVGLLLGVPFLRMHERVTMDYPRRLLTLEYPAAAPAANPAEQQPPSQAQQSTPNSLADPVRVPPYAVAENHRWVWFQTVWVMVPTGTKFGLAPDAGRTKHLPFMPPAGYKALPYTSGWLLVPEASEIGTDNMVTVQ